MTQMMSLGIEPSIEKRFWAKVEPDENGCWVWTASKQRGYGALGIGPRKVVRAHRLMAIACGMDDAEIVDHTCFNRACVNPGHLRPCTTKQNSEHRAGADKTNRSTGVRGVHFKKEKQKFVAYIKHKGKHIHLGYFDTVDEASKAAEAARDRYFTFHKDRAA